MSRKLGGGVMIALLFAMGWTLFIWGLLGEVYDALTATNPLLGNLITLVIFLSPLLFIPLFRLLERAGNALWPWLQRHLELHTDAMDAIPLAQVGLWVALAAGLALYAELMMIRIHGSAFHLFAYFKNVSLLSCFLGLGIGYTLGGRRPLTTPLILPLFAFQIALLHFLRFSVIADTLQNPVTEQINFGMNQARGLGHVAIVYGFLIMVFTLNALSFIPFGQLTARLMTRQPKLVAYSWNLIGSLGGILLFAVVSFLWTPPALWLLLTALGVMAFLRSQPTPLLASAVATALVLAFLNISFGANQFDVYSPYQVLTLAVTREDHHVLQVNNIYYQRILDLETPTKSVDPDQVASVPHYTLPYQFKRAPESVLVVGSGTGNDVASALRHEAQQIDAVEIDPAILAFGKALHPESPYQSPRVHTIVNDARNFIRYTDKKYDLIVYGLLDSHTLLASNSGVRLDSFVYTVEGFREVRTRLKEGGLVSLTFAVLTPELGHKLYLMLQEAFDGQSPMVYQTNYDNGYTFLIGNNVDWSTVSPPAGVREITAQFTSDDIRTDLSTDDWPFFYMPVRKYPFSYVTMVLMLLAVSTVLVLNLAPGARRNFSGSCFFLGAGFMLVETKGITELALVFGSTWIVISAVIGAILILAFLANLVVMRVGAPRPIVTYGLLFASLLVGLALSSADLSALPLWLNQTIMTLALTIPLFFSGFAFSSELEKAESVAAALSSNLLGSILGGFLEYNSMYFGFKALYLVALAMYGLAFLSSLQKREGAVQRLPEASDLLT